MNQPFEIHDATYLLRNRWSVALWAAPWVLAILGVVTALITKTPAFARLTPHLMIGGLVGFIYAKNQNPGARRLAATVRASRDGVQIDSASTVHFLPRADILEGFLLPSQASAPRVRLMRSDFQPPVDLEVRDEADGRGLLQALGLDSSQTVASFRTLSQLLAKPKWNRAAKIGMVASIGTLGMMLGVFGLPPAFGLLMPLIFMLFVALMLWPSGLHVGTDGVMITWLWHRRFVGYGAIESVTPFEHDEGSSRARGLLLALQGGEQLWVPVGRRGWDNERVAIIHERIREAMESQKQGDTEAFAALLRRGERSVSAWVTMLRSIGAGANAAHRVAPVAPERLWRIVADPSARASARAAAAVALGAGSDEEGRSRLSAIANATVEPKLRIALEAVTGSTEEAALAEALAELEAAEIGKAPLRVG